MAGGMRIDLVALKGVLIVRSVEAFIDVLLLPGLKSILIERTCQAVAGRG